MDTADEPLHEDPEIAALLDFEPVPRKCPRRGARAEAAAWRARVEGEADGDSALS